VTGPDPDPPVPGGQQEHDAADGAGGAGKVADKGGAKGGGRPGAGKPGAGKGAQGGRGGKGPGAKSGGRSARRRSREFAMQGLYQWLLSGESGGAIHAHIQGSPGFEHADRDHFDALLHGVIRDAEEIDRLILPFLDREVAHLSPVERATMMIGCYELLRHQEIPYRVVINEAVELAKSFGGTDGYKYVNGVLDKLAGTIRPAEAGGGR
jgi:N utilization substance protein B